MKKIYFASMILAAGMAACSQNDSPIVGVGLDDVYYVARMEKLRLDPAITGTAYRWTVDGKDVADTRDYIFVAKDEGTYRLQFEIIDSANPYTWDITVVVRHEDVEYTPYISKVYEYCPAPGQFVNTMPEFESGDTYADMLRKVENCISGTNDELITLGAYGGYVTFGFDHTVVNVEGEKDFRLWGNAFYDATVEGELSGSSEAGIVMVSIDSNGNGRPDDPWYELAGSAYADPATIHGYTITYLAPDPDREIIADKSLGIIDLNYIGWKDSEGAEAYIPKTTFHNQDYYPGWVDASALTFTGTRLPDNKIDVTGRGTYYTLETFAWGYADNHPNSEADLNSFDISWAVDSEGRRVSLPGIDFVRVYTGLNQYCGNIGETSTEISRAQDLHLPL